MEPGSRGEPRPEVLEKFSVQWYIKELQDLFVIADEARTSGAPEFGYITRLLERLSVEFVQADQIQTHHDQDLIQTYRTRAATLSRGTEEFFSTVELGRWLRVCQDAIAKGQTPEQISAWITPVLEQKLGDYGLRSTEASSAPIAPVLPPEPIQPLPTKPVGPKKNVRPQQSPVGKLGLAATMAAGALAGGYLLAEYLKSETAEPTAWHEQYRDIPPQLLEHVVGIPHTEQPVEFKPQADWRELNPGVYQWGERVVLAEPNGSALYIPKDTDYNKAFILPANPRGNIDWRGARFPVQAIQQMELTLETSGLWLDPQGHKYAVLDGGHLLYLTADGQPQTFLPFNETAPKPIAELDAYYKPRVDLSTIDTAIPQGFVDVETQPSLATIQCDLSYRTYDNAAAGVPIYPPDYKCQIPERAVADLAAVEAELNTHGYHLTIGDAKRPLVVQAFLHEVLGKWASKPTPQAPHVAGLALDVGLLDATYLPLFGGGFKLPSSDATTGKNLRSPKDKQQALDQGWSDQEYTQWKLMHDIFVAHGYTFNKSERWHVDYQK